jgi:hypothetical protein
MSVRDTVLCFLFILLMLGVIIVHDSTKRQQCEAKGGQFYSFWRGAHLCVKPDTITKDNSP